MAKLRNGHGICPPEVLKFLLDLFKYNDNSKNNFSDNYYRSSLVRNKDYLFKYGLPFCKNGFSDYPFDLPRIVRFCELLIFPFQIEALGETVTPVVSMMHQDHSGMSRIDQFLHSLNHHSEWWKSNPCPNSRDHNRGFPFSGYETSAGGNFALLQPRKAFALLQIQRYEGKDRLEDFLFLGKIWPSTIHSADKFSKEQEIFGPTEKILNHLL